MTAAEKKFYDDREAFMKSIGVEKAILIRGWNNPDSDCDEEEEGEERQKKGPPTRPTEEDIKNIRMIMMPDARAEEMERVEKELLGDQYGQGFTMHNTSFSYDVYDLWVGEVKQDYNNMRKWGEKFDLLLAFTSAIMDHNTWMHDHETGWEGDKMLKEMGERWKKLLKKSDDVLGIDAKFTRPGVICMLEQFKKAIDSLDQDTYDLKFKFQ